jgi:hypothetical protein
MEFSSIALRTVDAFLAEVPFAACGADVIWREGAASIMGADKALRCWRALLRTRGKLALTEAAQR